MLNRMNALPLRWIRRLTAPALVAALAGLAACAGPGLTPLPAGSDEAAVLQRWGAPTGRYAMPGGSRLEYATGPYGRTTWMVDLDSAGRVTGAQQVLDERNLQAVQGRLPGMTREELLRTLGRPGERRGGGRQGGEVWSWRFESPWCLWFQVSIGDDGIVRDGVFGPDPLCDDWDDL
jgi:hypothetical protein